MPPRARKAADAKPEADELPLVEGQAESTGGEAQPTQPGAEQVESNEQVTEPAAAQEPADTPGAPSGLTYHWESVNGDGSEPCRHCPPGTPPPGAGSYGCPHGQWVRVLDAP